MPKQQRVRDPLHDLIEFNVERSQLEDVLWRVIQTRPFQRLRRIKQLGFSDFVYPGATHSRLLHSVGVFHTARRLMEVIDKYVPAKDARVDQALAAALVHDLGHGPFSHAFEKIGERFNLKMANHEAVSDMLIRDGEVFEELREMGSGFANDVADMVSGSGTPTIYSAVVSSQFDADRLDYMRRDRLMTGSHAGIDFEWLMANLEVGEATKRDSSLSKPLSSDVRLSSPQRHTFSGSSSFIQPSIFTKRPAALRRSTPNSFRALSRSSKMARSREQDCRRLTRL